jgi:lantibiotic leader peptide-processing serine protease
MLRIARCTIVVVLVPLVFNGCRDVVEPSSTRETIPSAADAASSSEAPAGQSSRHLVVFNGDAAPSDFAERVSALGGAVLSTLDGVGLATVGGLTEAAVEELRRTEGVKAVEADLVLGAELEPADLAAGDATDVSTQSHASPTAATFYPRQWNLRAIGADVAWDAGRLGKSEVSAAILDTGIDYLHPDLLSRVDLSRSVSLLSDPVSDPSDEDALVQARFPGRHLITDLHSHGTAVSALIASNAHLLAGVTQQTTLFGVKVHDRTRRNRISAYLKGIIYAADHEADVIHLSIPLEFNKHENPGLVAAVNRAINYAHREGAVMVAAAGNAAQSLDHDADRFRFCNAVHVICVSATGPTSAAGVNGPWENPDAVAPYTNFGRSAIDVAGPGGTAASVPATRVWLVCSQATLVTGVPSSVCIGGRSLIWSSTGTSFGAAATSGLAALLVSTMGKDRPEQIEAAIEKSADDLGDPGTDPYYGRGRINVARAVGTPQ